MCVFSYIMLAIITVCISDLQAFNDLLLFYNEYQEHKLEQYIIHTFCLYCIVYLFLMYIFKYMSCPNEAPRFFVYKMLCHIYCRTTSAMNLVGTT